MPREGSTQLVRVPLSWPYNPRTSNTRKDSRRVNVVDEKEGGKTFTRKRPGLTEYFTGFPTGTGQGISVYNGSLFAVLDDVLYADATADSGASGVTWTRQADAPWVARALHRVVQCNGVTYVIGAVNANGNTLNDVWSLTGEQGWKICTASAPFTPRRYFMTGTIGDRIYVIGGGDGGSVYADVWSSANGTDWVEETAAMTTGGRVGAGALSADNGIYLFGGQDVSLAQTDTTFFTTDGKVWTVANDGSTDPWGAGGERDRMATWLFQNKLWIGGGFASGGGGTWFNDVWFSSDGARTWMRATAAAFDTGLYDAASVVYANKMWLIDGIDPTTADTGNVYASSDGVTWTKVSTAGPANPSSGAQAVVLDTPGSLSAFNYRTMAYLGGYSFGVVTAAVWLADLDTAVPLVVSLSPLAALQPYQFNPFLEGRVLLIKNQSNLYVLDGGTVIPVTDVGYPAETVPGLVVLGGFAYVMQPDGLIRNCNLDDPYHWPSLNAVGADYEADQGTAIVKYLNYLVAFGQWTTQFFFDAGNALGSPLQPYLTGNMEIGCDDPQSIVNIGATVCWVSHNRELTRQVMIFEGLQPKVISTPAIERIINDTATWIEVHAFADYAGGHLCYVLFNTTLPANPAWAYDFSTQQWFEWTRAGSLTDPFAFASNASTFGATPQMLLQDRANGIVYACDADNPTDAGASIFVLLITGKVDAGNNYRKFWGPLTVIGDRTNAQPFLSWTDDDYQSFTTGRAVDMSSARPQLFCCGQSERRAWKYVQEDNEPMRLEALEMYPQQGGP